MFTEVSYKKLLFTENWSIGNNALKSNISKSFNSLCNIDMKFISNPININSLSILIQNFFLIYVTQIT